MELSNQSFIKTKNKNKVVDLFCQGLWGHYIVMALMYILAGFILYKGVSFFIQSIFGVFPWWLRFITLAGILIIEVKGFLEDIKNSSNKLPQYEARRILFFSKNTGIYFTNGTFIELGKFLELDSLVIDLHSKPLKFELDSDTLVDAGGLALYGFKVNILRNINIDLLDYYVKGSDGHQNNEDRFTQILQSQLVSKANQFVGQYHYDEENTPIKDEKKIREYLQEGLNEILLNGHVPYYASITGVEFPTAASPELRNALEAEEISKLVAAAKNREYASKGEQIAAIKNAAASGDNPVVLSDLQAVEIWKLSNGGQDINTHGAPILGVGNLTGSGGNK